MRRLPRCVIQVAALSLFFKLVLRRRMSEVVEATPSTLRIALDPFVLHPDRTVCHIQASASIDGR
jgi:hypothetical protein